MSDAPALAAAERQRPDEARRAVVRLVVGRQAEVGVEVVEVLRRREVAVLVLERLPAPLSLAFDSVSELSSVTSRLMRHSNFVCSAL